MPPKGSQTGRRGGDCQPQGGRELEWGGRGNRGERLLTVVRTNQAKRLRDLHQKGRGTAEELPLLLSQTRTPPAKRESLTHPRAGKRTVVSPYSSATEERESEEEPRGGRVWEGGKSAGPPVRGGRGGESIDKSTPPASAPTSTGSRLTRKPEKPTSGEQAEDRYGTISGCVLRRSSPLVHAQLGQGLPHRSSAAGPYCEGDTGQAVGQSQSFAPPLDPW
jgi:hypothetical protein